MFVSWPSSSESESGKKAFRAYRSLVLTETLSFRPSGHSRPAFNILHIICNGHSWLRYTVAWASACSKTKCNTLKYISLLLILSAKVVHWDRLPPRLHRYTVKVATTRRSELTSFIAACVQVAWPSSNLGCAQLPYSLSRLGSFYKEFEYYLQKGGVF